MLGAVLCMLFGYATAQKLYYLGDDITVSVSNHNPNHNFPKTIFEYYIQFASSTETLKLIGPNVTVGALTPRKSVKLYADLGTFANPMQLPAYVSGMAKIVARARDDTAPHAVVHGTVENITISRHILHVASSGKVEMWGKRTLSFNVEYSGPTIGTPSKASDWVIALVHNDSANPKLFTTYDTMNVTTVMAPTNVTGFYTLTGQWKKTNPPPMSGLYLVIGLKNGTSTKFNTWSVTGNSLNSMYSWVVVNSSFKVMAPTSVPEYNLTSIKMNGGGVDSAWWLVAHESTTGKRYALSCQPRTASMFNNFEWMVLPLQPMEATTALPVGQYYFEAIWTDRMAAQKSFMDVNYPTIALRTTMMSVVHHGSNDMTPITFNRAKAHKLGAITANQNLSVDVFSIFGSVWIQWFKMKANYTNSSNGANTTGWFAEGTPMKVTTTPGQTTTIFTTVPESVFQNMSAVAKTARLYGWAQDCQMKHFAQSFASGNLTVPPSPAPAPAKKNNSLGAGAIVGIVCAVVFVCGVAAWWLCMKNSKGSDRYQQLGDNQ